VNVDDLHNHSTFRSVYEKFSRIFLDSFCDYRRNSPNRRDAIEHARRQVEESFFAEIKSNRLNTKLVVIAYQKICTDTEIVEKAIKYYLGMEKAK
jgi:hypothetical protein